MVIIRTAEGRDTRSGRKPSYTKTVKNEPKAGKQYKLSTLNDLTVLDCRY